MTQHTEMTVERWARFDIDRQILMIANEMNRARHVLADEDPRSRERAYERVLRLADLTISGLPRPALLRELLRWRDLVAELFVADAAAPERHLAALRALLLLRPAAARQIPLLLDS